MLACCARFGRTPKDILPPTHFACMHMAMAIAMQHQQSTYLNRSCKVIKLKATSQSGTCMYIASSAPCLRALPGITHAQAPTSRPGLCPQAIKPQLAGPSREGVRTRLHKHRRHAMESGSMAIGTPAPHFEVGRWLTTPVRSRYVLQTASHYGLCCCCCSCLSRCLGRP